MSRVSFEMPLPSSCEKKTQNIWRKNNSPPMFEPRCILHGNLTLPMPMISRKKTPLKKKRGDDLTHHPLKFFGNCGRGQSAGASEWDEIPGSTKIGDGTWTMNGSMYMCINNMYIYIYLEPFHVFFFWLELRSCFLEVLTFKKLRSKFGFHVCKQYTLLHHVFNSCSKKVWEILFQGEFCPSRPPDIHSLPGRPPSIWIFPMWWPSILGPGMSSWYLGNGYICMVKQRVTRY